MQLPDEFANITLENIGTRKQVRVRSDYTDDQGRTRMVVRKHFVDNPQPYLNDNENRWLLDRYPDTVWTARPFDVWGTVIEGRRLFITAKQKEIWDERKTKVVASGEPEHPRADVAPVRAKGARKKGRKANSAGGKRSQAG